MKKLFWVFCQSVCNEAGTTPSPPQFVPVVEAMPGEVSDTEEEVGRQEERRDHPT